MYRIHYDIIRTTRYDGYHNHTTEDSSYLEGETVENLLIEIEKFKNKFIEKESDRQFNDMFGNIYTRERMNTDPSYKRYWYDNLKTLEWKTPIMKIEDDNDTIIPNSDEEVFAATRSKIDNWRIKEAERKAREASEVAIKREKQELETYLELKKKFENNS